MITINGNILGPNDAKPDTGSVIQFSLSASMISAAGVAILPFVQTAALSNTDGSFSIQLEPTTTALPNNCYYDVTVVARFAGVPANWRIGRVRIRSTPSTQSFSVVGLGDEPDALHINREIPFGVMDGTNGTFSLRKVPQDGTEFVFVNEGLQRQDAYLLDGNQLTMITAPTPGQRVKVFYLNSAFAAPGHYARETPDGIVDGVNTVFTLRNAPASGLEMGFVNESYQIPGVAYTISGQTITFIVPPAADSRISFWYPASTLYPIHHRDIFTGDGVATSFALSAPIFNLSEMVFNGTLYQERNIPNYYTCSADQKTLMFSTPPSNGQKVVAYYVGTD